MTVSPDTVAEAVALRRDLHADPEVGLHLPRTSAVVLAALDGLDLEVHRSELSSSFVAVLRGSGASGDGSRHAVLLRADMDALPVVETADVPYRSTNGAMHACGHDLHTAALVGTAQELAARRDELPGDVLLVFQAGEEAVDGARVMLDEGVVARAAEGLEVAAALALHVRSNAVPSGHFASLPGAVTASGTSITMTFTGQGGHGSAPHQAADPVPALVSALATVPVVLGRSVDAHDPVVFTAGSVQAGARRNVIPDTARAEATMRTFDAGVRDQAVALVRRVADGAALMHGVAVSVEVTEGYPTVLNDLAEHSRAVDVVHQVVGPDGWQPLRHADAITEDFSRFAAVAPTVFLFLGATPPGDDHRTAPANHAADAVFDDAVLARAIAVETTWAVERLAAAADGRTAP